MKEAGKEIFRLFKKYYFLLFCMIALLMPDLLLKSLVTPGVFKEGYVPVASLAFTTGWVLFLTVLCVLVLPKRAGKILFSVSSVLFMALSISEYIYYKIFDQFFWLKAIMLAGEGADYFGYAVKLIDTRLIVCAVISICTLVLALLTWKRPCIKGKMRYLLMLIPVSILVLTHVCMQPALHGDATNQWDTWRKPRVVYKNFNDINKSFEITGFYQFVYLNGYTAVFPNNVYGKEDFKKVDAYFEEKGESPVNEYTNLFQGKNVIAVMMESMDTWMIDKKYTPTIHYMMKHGIQFTNYNAPFFGAGFTFSSEFAFNTGYFTPVSAVSASNFSQNTFPYSLARLFKEAGYTTNSFHFNDGEFYNRGIMHKSFGYEKYNGFADFGLTGTEAELDSNMLKNDAIYDKMTQDTPFFDFYITYSAHLPYTGESSKLLLAKEYHSDLINKSTNEEKNNIQILAADTDAFFKQLLERLEEDGLLDNTVIVAYTDHFAYGVSDSALLEKWKGKTLSYTVPAFIYAKGLKPTRISKPMMTIDWAPTLVNLFGLNREGRYIGNDVLEPSNKGFVLFETWAWMDENMHYIPSEEGTTEETAYIDKQNQRVKDSLEINDIVVLGDYYKKR